MHSVRICPENNKSKFVLYIFNLTKTNSYAFAEEMSFEKKCCLP